MGCTEKIVRKSWLPAFSLFPTLVLSKAFIIRVIKNLYLVKEYGIVTKTKVKRYVYWRRYPKIKSRFAEIERMSIREFNPFPNKPFLFSVYTTIFWKQCAKRRNPEIKVSYNKTSAFSVGPPPPPPPPRERHLDPRLIIVSSLWRPMLKLSPKALVMTRDSQTKMNTSIWMLGD